MSKYGWLFWLFLVLPISLFSENRRFSAIETQTDVPFSNINDLLEDSYGYLWIATQNGLMKFNGYEYAQYHQEKNGLTSLSHNNCRKLLEDSRKRLWICTDNGVVLYNREVDNFQTIELPTAANHNVTCIEEDKNGNIWILTFRELIKINPDDFSIQAYPLLNGVCITILNDKIWIGSLSAGIRIFDIKTENIVPFKIIKDNKEINTQHIRTIKASSDGIIFIGTQDCGLVIYNPKNEDIKTYTTLNAPQFIKSNYIQTFYEDSEKMMWIGSVNGILLKYDLQKKDFSSASFSFPSGIELLTISSIIEDSQKNIWVGTHHYWLFSSNKVSSSFNIYKHQNKNPKSLSYNAISCFCDDHNNILVGTDGGGLNKFEIKSGTFVSDKRFGNIILDIKKGNENEFWISTWGNIDKGLMLYNTKTDAIINYTHDPNNPNSLPTNFIRNVLVEGQYVWIATDGGGLCRMDRKTGKIESKNNSKDRIFSKDNPQWVGHLMRDKKNRMWICTSEGIVCYDHGKYTTLSFSNGNDTLSQNETKMSLEDSKGRIWAISASRGLYLYSEDSQSFINYSKLKNLPTNLSSIIEDENGNLWITASNEVISFNVEKDQIKRFDLKNDLNGTSFNSKAIFKYKGHIYLGSNNGIFIFNPNKTYCNEREPKVYLKDLYIWEKKEAISDSSILKKRIAFTDTITLTHDDNYFSIDYFGINFDQPEGLKYSYQLVGFHPEWIDVQKEKRAYFSNLPAGTYSFVVKVSDLNGITSESKPLTITILPSWWNTWWFRSLTVLTFIFSLILFIFIRDRKMKEKQEKLELLVSERTNELKLKNDEIQRQKENLETQNKRLDETLDTKDKILSVIAHDLRNPLTAIIGNLSLLSHNEEKNPEEKRIKQVYKSAQNLQEQMENLLHWARIQNESILYSPKETFLDAITKESITLLQNLACEKRISISFVNETNRSAFIDERMISTVIRNLLNNAIKFTKEDGNINIKISENKDNISWKISDNGVGMTEQQIDNLFNQKITNTTFGTNNEKGSGLGLKICQKFIILNKGTLSITSNKGIGTNISILLPKGQKFHDADIVNELIDQSKEIKKKKSQTILLVDDNAEILDFLCNMFKDQYLVISATDGDEALELARKEIPDLILSDIVMPKMNGIELCSTLKNDVLTQHIPIVMLTSEDAIDNQIEGFSIGADDYVTKPFNAEILRAKIQSILKNKERISEHFRTQMLQMPNLEIPESQDNVFMNKINQILKENISETNLTVEFLADKTALSRVQLFRKLKAISGCSPSEYIKAVRLQFAAEILKTGKHAIADVAYEVGFSDPKYFSICFSERYGMTPSQFAKKE